nr:MAG TPA: hypothetical protein [Caudoviricetes sp.]
MIYIEKINIYPESLKKILKNYELTRQVFLLVSMYFLSKYELIRNYKKSFTSNIFTSCLELSTD